MESKNKKIIYTLSAIICTIIIVVSFLVKKDEVKKGDLIAIVNGKDVYTHDLQEFITNFLNARVPLQFEKLTLEQKTGLLKQYGVEREIYKEAKHSNVGKDPKVKNKIKAYKSAVIKEAYLDTVAESRISNEIIQIRYQSKLPKLEENAKDKKEYHASHILVASLAEANEANEALKRKDFASVAQEYSLDEGSKVRGGDLGFFSTEKMISEFSEQVIILAPEEVSPPFKTDFGWHIVKLHEVRNSTPTSLEEMHEEIKKELYYEALEKHIAAVSQNVTVELVK